MSSTEMLLIVSFLLLDLGSSKDLDIDIFDTKEVLELYMLSLFLSKEETLFFIWINSLIFRFNLSLICVISVVFEEDACFKIKVSSFSL